MQISEWDRIWERWICCEENTLTINQELNNSFSEMEHSECERCYNSIITGLAAQLLFLTS